jgi:hypothetical protein
MQPIDKEELIPLINSFDFFTAGLGFTHSGSRVVKYARLFIDLVFVNNLHTRTPNSYHGSFEAYEFKRMSQYFPFVIAAWAATHRPNETVAEDLVRCWGQMGKVRRSNWLFFLTKWKI